MKKDQYYPFDDFLKITVSGLGADAEELPWREIVTRMQTMPRERNSEILEYLTGIFRAELKTKGEDKALEKFWSEVDELRGSPWLTEDMFEVLKAADEGSIKSSQIIVRAAPITTYLPFIARSLRYVVAQHKYLDTGVGVLEEIRASWNAFLPARTGGEVTYSDADLQKLFDIAVRQESGRITSKAAVRGYVAEALNISDEYLRKRIRTGGRKGRPKK